MSNTALVLECKREVALDNRDGWPLILWGHIHAWIDDNRSAECDGFVRTDYATLIAKPVSECTTLELAQRLFYSDVGRELVARFEADEERFDELIDEVAGLVSDDDVADDVALAIDYEDTLRSIERDMATPETRRNA